jgi:hypothetical protein
MQDHTTLDLATTMNQANAIADARKAKEDHSLALHLTASDPYLPEGERHSLLMSYLHEHVTVRLTISQEDTHPSQAGFEQSDGTPDAALAAEIQRDWEQGNDWAWGVVQVRATFLSLEASEYIGQASYASEQDFRANSGYYEDMLETTIADLATQLLDNRKAHLEIAKILMS